jgi:hypothetical protein
MEVAARLTGASAARPRRRARPLAVRAHRALSVDSLAALLRGLPLLITACVENDRAVLDLRTVGQEEHKALAAGLEQVLRATVVALFRP